MKLTLEQPTELTIQSISLDGDPPLLKGKYLAGESILARCDEWPDVLAKRVVPRGIATYVSYNRDVGFLLFNFEEWRN